MKANNTIKAIIESSKQVFITQGLNSVSMTDIVNASGYSRGGVYRYFSNVDEVFEALMMNEITNLNTENFSSFNDFLQTEIFELNNIDQTLRLAGYEYMMHHREDSILAQSIFNKHIALIQNLKQCTESQARKIFVLLEGLTVLSLSGILDDTTLQQCINLINHEV